MTADPIWDDLPPHLVGPLADQVAEAYRIAREFGYKDGHKDGDRDGYWRGYADAIENLLTPAGPAEMPSAEGVDPVAVEACRRLSERLSPEGAVTARPHRHHHTLTRCRPIARRA